MNIIKKKENLMHKILDPIKYVRNTHILTHLSIYIVFMYVSHSCIRTTVWLHYLDFNKIVIDEAR